MPYVFPDVGIVQGIPARGQPIAPVGINSRIPGTCLTEYVVAGEPRT
jgi:hypothetical protein